MFVTRVVSRAASMSIHYQNNTHVLQGKPIRRRPAVVFRATEMRFPARATSRLALAPDSSSPRTILSFLSFTVYNLSIMRVDLWQVYCHMSRRTFQDTPLFLYAYPIA